jgi:DNA-binding transcriptional MerR regulator
MPTDYSLADLTKLTGVSPRTVRYYISQGLLPAPTQQGSNARYSDAHLGRIRVIRKLQSAHLPLAEIRRRLDSLRPDEVASLAETDADAASPDGTALDYIQSLLKPTGSPVFTTPIPPAAMAAARSTSIRADEASKPSEEPPPASGVGEPDRAQWERITLDPDVEIHIRRPLTRQHNRRVERLIAIARELMKEE